MDKENKLLLVIAILLCVMVIFLFINMVLIGLGVFDETCIINWLVTLSPAMIALLIEMYILIRMVMGKDD